MSSVSSLRELTNKQLSPAEETFTDIKEIIVKSEEEIDGGLDVSETTPIINHLTDPLQRYVKKEEDSSDQVRNSIWDQEEPDPLAMKEEQDDLQIKEEGNELCISQDEEEFVLKKETEPFIFYSTNEVKDHREPKLIRDQILSPDGCAAENQDQEESDDEDTELSSDEELKQNKRSQKTRG
ncbi:hypothetical protein CHARACLAT_030303, partial [Characodon lateralis]|nr:hypothetical protein [Characodon lateralis]